jgi:hypothetical protein
MGSRISSPETAKDNKKTFGTGWSRKNATSSRDVKTMTETRLETLQAASRSSFRDIDREAFASCSAKQIHTQGEHYRFHFN